MVKITINENVTKLKEKSKAKNTQDKYEGDWLKFTNYCQNKYHLHNEYYLYYVYPFV